MKTGILVIFFSQLSRISAQITSCDENKALKSLSRCIMLSDLSDHSIQETIKKFPEISCPCLDNLSFQYPNCIDNFQSDIDCTNLGVKSVILEDHRDRRDGGDEEHQKHNDHSDNDRDHDKQDDKDDHDKHDDKDDHDKHDDKDDHDKHDDKDDQDKHDDKDDHDKHDDKKPPDEGDDNTLQGERNDSHESNGKEGKLSASEVTLLSVGCAIIAAIILGVLINIARTYGLRRSVPLVAKVDTVPMVEPRLIKTIDIESVPSLAIATPIFSGIQDVDVEVY